MFAVLQGRQSKSRLQSILNWCWAQIKAGATSEFGCCDETEIERMGRDVRMSASELRAVAKRGPGAANLLLRRMAALDLEPNEVCRIEPAAVRDLQRVCTLCKSHKRCARDIVRRAPLAAWEHYCPNTGTLTALNAMPWATRREW
jgi:hypothetical protein